MHAVRSHLRSSVAQTWTRLGVPGLRTVQHGSDSRAMGDGFSCCGGRPQAIEQHVHLYIHIDDVSMLCRALTPRPIPAKAPPVPPPPTSLGIPRVRAEVKRPEDPWHHSPEQQ